MPKQINVVGQDGKILESTYRKRAKQLVKKDRAVWLGEDTICLTQQQEEIVMDNIIQVIEAEEDTVFETQENVQERSADRDEKALREFARRRLEKKHSLIVQVFDYLAMIFFIFLYAATWDGVFLAFFLFLWGLRLLVRIVRFARPAFKEGFVAYFKRRREQSLEEEYNKVLRMGEAALREEMGV